MATPRSIARFDVGSFLSSRGVQWEPVNEEINLDCPFCSDTRKRFFINSRTKANICHNCGWRGELYMFLRKFLGVSTEQIDRIVEQKFFTRRVEVVEEKHIIELPPAYQPLVLPEDRISKRYWRYVTESRQLTPSLAIRYHFGFCWNGPYGGRLIVPVYWYDNLVNWIARDVTGKKEPKVLTPKGNEQSDFLFNLDRLWGKPEIVLTEGVFDALRMPEQAVASFGKKLSNEQLNLLTQSQVKHAIVAYDSDAMYEAYTVAKRLRRYMKVSIALLPDGEDPGSLSEGRMRQVLRDAIPYRFSDLMRVKRGGRPQ